MCIVIACKSDQCHGGVEVLGVEHGDFDEFLKKVDLGGHVWCRNRGIEDTGASICEIHSVLQIFDSDISKFVWYWRLHSYKLSKEISEDTAIGETSGGFSREGDSVGVFPRFGQRLSVVACVGIRVSENKQFGWTPIEQVSVCLVVEVMVVVVVAVVVTS